MQNSFGQWNCEFLTTCTWFLNILLVSFYLFPVAILYFLWFIKDILKDFYLSLKQNQIWLWILCCGIIIMIPLRICIYWLELCLMWAMWPMDLLFKIWLKVVCHTKFLYYMYISLVFLSWSMISILITYIYFRWFYMNFFAIWPEKEKKKFFYQIE